MTIHDIIEIAKGRGLTVYLKDGSPVLYGDKQEATPALMDCLKRHKQEITDHLKAEEAKKAEVRL